MYTYGKVTGQQYQKTPASERPLHGRPILLPTRRLLKHSELILNIAVFKEVTNFMMRCENTLDRTPLHTSKH